MNPSSILLTTTVIVYLTGCGPALVTGPGGNPTSSAPGIGAGVG